MNMKNVMHKLLMLLGIILFGSTPMTAQADVTGYETVTVSIPATAYNANAGGTGKGAPQMARVKYNKQCALVITSDDMGTGEYLNNWALMNGYPLYGDWRLGNDGKVNWGICPRGEDALNAPYNTTYMGARSQNVNDYQPLTFTDDAGKEHRFTATSAIWPASYNDNNYAHMQGDEAQIMVRTGWSFAQHDVNNITGDTDAEKIASIASRFQPLSELWENNVTGIGLKVMVEPNGDKNYIDATAQSNEMCWSIFQSADATHPAISNNVSTWTTSLPTTFSDKSNGSTARTFPNADATKEQNFLTQAESAIAAGSTNPIFYGCHGMGTYPRQLVTDIATNATYKDKVWVTSADEYWEYYNIYHNAIIGTPTWDGSQLTFTVQVPTYKKNQFRELTINIPGLTGGTDCTLTSSDGTVTTGSYAQTNDASKGYVVNFGMETKILDYIDELTTLYRNNPTNLFVKRDAQYLIDQLLPGATKTAKQNALDKEYDYSYLATANLQENGVTVATKTLSSGYYDAATDVKYYIPRYILEGTTLYKTTGNGAMTQSNNTISQPWYGNYLSVNTADISASYTYAKEMENVVFYTEAENISGHGGSVPDHTTNWNTFPGRVEALCSAGSGVKRDNNNFGTITTLEPGTYKVTIGVVASASNDGGYYSIRVGGTDEANEVDNYAGATKDQLTEYTTDEFTVKENKTVTVYHSGSSNVALDYVFIQKTADFEPSDPTVTLSSNVLAAQVNSTVTLRTTPVWNGKGALTSLKFQYKTTGGADSEFADIATVNDPVSDTEYTQTYTPTTLGTYVFRAVLTDADGTIIKTTDDAATAASAGAVAISVLESVPYDGDYTLHLIDNAGNEVFTQSVTHATVSGGNNDPLADQYRSPFVSSYLYFDSQAEAQANSGTPSFWNQEDIYVGYTVDATKMASTKKYAIYANDRYMHAVPRADQSHVYNNLFCLYNQDKDLSNDNTNANTVLASTLPFIDNNYMWTLGDDPYNFYFQNVGTGRYAYPSANSSGGLVTSKPADSYCLLYWEGDTSNQDYFSVRYKGATNATDYHVMYQSSDGGNWRVSNSSNGAYAQGSKLYIKELPELNVNVVNPTTHAVEYTMHGYYNSAATMPSFVPFFLKRTYTSGQTFYYDTACTNAIATGATFDSSKFDGSNIYMSYELDTNWNTENLFLTSTSTTQYWYAVRFGNSHYLNAGTSGDHSIGSAGNNATTSTTADNSHWALYGSPYALKLVNRDASNKGMFAGADMTLTGSSASIAKMYAESSAVATIWEMRDFNNSNVSATYRSLPAIMPQGSASGEAPYFFLYANSNSLNPTDAGNCRAYQYDSKGTTTIAAALTLSTSSNTTYVDEPITLTATATPSAGQSVIYFAIEQETSTNTWEVVGTAYEGANVTGEAEKDGEGVVTVTYAFTPSFEGTFNFRAKAYANGDTESPLYTTDESQAGSAVSVTATVKPFTVGSDNYTIVLVDKAGNELYTESNVPASRVSEANSVSGRNGDPLNNDWRSPLVTRYFYYSTKADAQGNTGSNLFDWASTAATPTVYVGYEVSDAIDLNSTHFSSLSDLMNTRVARSATEATLVRDADSFGKMYLLKFKTSAVYHSEDGSDKVETDETPAGTNVYPYTNGDGPMYIYTDSRYQNQKDNGASTRTRWPWFLVSPNGDPYHVYITSWQNSHASSDKSTNYYSYLRTFYQDGVGIVTNNVTDDPHTLDGNNNQILPTDYMLLRADDSNGTYKLMTVAAIDNGTTTERRTVTSLEQYWRNNPTAQIQAGRSESNNGELTPAEKTTLQNKGWNNYNAYVNAAGWTGGTGSGNKSYANSEHWYQSIQLGNGSFDLVETNIDGVLVLLDNHGWEIMRQPIVEKDDPDYESVKAALRKFDSPMVSQYKFYSTRNVNHKVYGYHKFDIITNTGSKTPLAASTRVDADKTITSLADYEPHTSGGALTDLYVTYEVKAEYANSYVGAATEAETSASQFLVRQGSNYAKASGTAITTTTDAAAADNWYLKPNFNIDAEMGYLYNNGTANNEPSKAELETIYYNAGWNGFDPYNLRIQNVTTGTYFNTDASTATIASGIWTGNGSEVSLGDTATVFTAESYDIRTARVTNATFMAVQDGNGNMRLMPRFQHEEVVQGFTALAEQADDQPAGNTTHAQTTLLTTPVTYHIIDNSGADVFGALSYEGAGFAVPKEYQSPMVEEYYYHSSLEDAQNNRTTASVTTVKPGDEVWVSYKVKDDFSSKDWIVYGQNGTYLHAVSRNNQTDNRYLWWMENQNKDRANSEATSSLSTTNMPFLDNSYAWQFGENADPYNATFLNKAVHRYISSNSGNMNHLIPADADANFGKVGKYAIVYYEEGSDDAVIYERDAKKYIYLNNNGQWFAKDGRDNNGRMVFDCNVPAIAINIVRNGKVECTLDGFYKSGCTWTPFVPLFLERYAASNQAFYYDQACENAISGQVDDATVTTNKAVYVSYTLDTNKWGTLDKNSSTTIVMPSPTNDKVEWYSMVSNNKTFFIDGNNQLVSGSFKAGDDVDTNDNKKGQWALMGTPYNVKIVNRYAGSTSYLGIPSEINNNPIQLPATVQPEGTENVVDTWEVCQGMGNSGYVLQFRPQGSLSGQATYGYLGQDGNTNGKLGVTVNPNGNLQVKLTWKKETDAKIVTFKLYDREGNYMADETNGAIADAEIHGVSIGDDLSAIFNHTNMQRRYCEYTFYSDAEMTNAVTKASDNLNETVYVKWDYTDDAPIFSQTAWDKRDYQYYMLGVWGFNNYNLMDVEGEGTPESPYTFKPNNTVGTPRDLKHQFAIVGNPYGFKLYNRAADKDIKRNAALEITFADYETDGTTPTEEITFDLPIVSGKTYTSTETHFRSTKTGRYLNVTGTNENKLFSMTDNAGGNTRFRYIIVPVRVFKEGAVSSTAEKDYRMYALEMNPSNTARTTDARITTNDLRATGNAIGNARDFNHAFCNYTYYQKYDWNTSVSAPVPDDGLSYYGGKDQNKRQFIATYTVDQEAFERLYYLDNSPNHGNAYSSKGAESTLNAGSYTTLSDSRLSEVKADITDIYRWKFTGDPYDLQIHNVSMGEFADNYALAVKVPTETSDTAPTEAAGTLVLLTEDLKTGVSDTESYGQYSHWEIIKRSDNYYVFWNIETPERYTYSLTSQANKLNKNNLYVTVPPFENGSTTVPNINQVEWNLVDVFNHYDVTWHVMEKTGETTYTEVASDTKVVDENVTLTIEDLPTSVKRHFCDYEKMYSDAACTTEITEHTVNAATDIYVPYTLDSGAPDFVTEADVPSNIVEKNWYEIGFGCPDVSFHIYYNATYDKMDRNNTNTTDEIRDLTDYQNYRWALVGTPYGVKFYNKVKGAYLTSDGVPGNTTTLSSSGTAFDLVDDFTGEFCAIFDAASGTYLNASAQLQTNNTASGTAAEFSNTYGVVKVAFVLHYSEKTLRSTKTTPEVIKIDTYQKLDKKLDDVLPTNWKRAFCQYTYNWDAQTTETATATSTVETVSQAMVDAYNARRTEADPYLYVHVTYDFETNAPFKWSTADKEYTGKHWYYLVNNHRPNGELGKMVYRDSGPKLRVSTALKENQLYLNNFEWCVIGDPYGFKMLNRYDPDQRYDEYLRVMESQDSHGDGLQLEQSGTDSQNIFEMMPGQYSYNFWMHPVYSDYIGEDEEDSDNDDVYNEYSYVGNNFNGSAAIIPNDQRSMTYLKTNSAANFRLEIQSDATLSEYVKYAGFVGGLKYDKVTDAMRADAADGDLSDEDKAAVRELVDDPENIVQMTQGYYRIVPYTQEDGSDDHKYIRGYLDDRERTGSGGYNRNLKVETQTAAEYDPSTIFWFEGTTSDGTENGYPRYFIKTQGLSLDHTGLNSIDAENDYKCRYENLGGAIAQIKIASLTGDMPHDYLSCTSTATETSTDQCFDEQAGQYKTRFYLQKVGEGGNELSFKLKVNDNGDGYCYSSFYAPYDVDITTEGAVAFIGKLERENSNKGKTIEGTSYIEASYKLRCNSVNDYTGKTQRYVPAGTPVLVRIPAGSEENDGDGTLYIQMSLPETAPSEAVPSSANSLQGVYLTQKLEGINGTVYVFGKSSKYGPGFFKNSGNIEGMVKDNHNVNHNKMYYVTPSTQSRQYLLDLFEVEEETGIVTNVSGFYDTPKRNDGIYYDLQGRRIENPNRPGVYIVNGKKVVIK